MTHIRRLTILFVMCWINLAVTIVDAGSPPPRARVEHCHLCKGAIQGQAAVTRSGSMTAVWHTNCLHQLQGGHQ